MRTSLPVSTISYNSVGFLCSTLERMMDNGEIAFYAFIPHHGESGDKDHVHLYVEPSKLRSQDDWKAEYFREFDPQVPDKPLSVTTWRKSNWKDWYLYGLHDRAYIALKARKSSTSIHQPICTIPTLTHSLSVLQNAMCQSVTRLILLFDFALSAVTHGRRLLRLVLSPLAV